MLTIRQYIEKYKVKGSTVRSWIYNKRIQAMIIETPIGGFYMVEDQLPEPGSEPKRGRPRRPLVAGEDYDGHSRPEIWPSKDTAERYFNHSIRKCRLSYAELQKRFLVGDTLESIGHAAGVTKERIRQYYEIYFSQFLGKNKRWEARKEAKTKARKEEILESVRNNPALEKICEMGRNRGWNIGLVETTNYCNRRRQIIHKASDNKVVVNGKSVYFKVLWSGSVLRIPGSRRQYHRTNVYKALVRKSDYVVLVEEAPKGDGKILVIPVRELLELKAFSSKSNKPVVTIYPQLKKMEIYNNQKSKIDWLKWEERWDLLDREEI